MVFSDSWHVFPIRSGAKTPLTKHGLLDATNDPAQIAAWREQFPGCNWAVACGPSGLAVVDIDGPEGEEAWGAYELAHGWADTLQVRTPKGGRHIYFEGEAANSVRRIGPEIDVRGSGGYVLLPGSEVDGSVYTVLSDLPVAPLPETYDLSPAKSREPARAPDHLVWDTPQALEMGFTRAWDISPAADGERNNRAFGLAAELCDLAISEAKALEIVGTWNQRSDTPLDEEELGLAVWSGYRNRVNEPGCYAPDPRPTAERLRALGVEVKEPEGPVRLRAVLDRTVPPVRELIPGLVERGTVTFLAGPGGSHKSRVALQWGMSLDAGLPVWGRPVEPADFIYLSYEDHADEVARRAQAIAGRLGVPATADPGAYWDLSRDRPKLAVVPEGSEPMRGVLWDRLLTALEGSERHRFIVVDSTYNALLFGPRAKIDEGAVMGAIGLLQGLCEEADATLLMLWHPSQAGQERGDASGWSVAWHNAPRSRLSLTPVKGAEDQFELRVEKRNHGAKGPPVLLRWSDGILEPMGAGEINALMMAVVEIAVKASRAGQPLLQRGPVPLWITKELEKELKRSPGEREVKQALIAASGQGYLVYRKAFGKQPAGYCAPGE